MTPKLELTCLSLYLSLLITDVNRCDRLFCYRRIDLCFRLTAQSKLRLASNTSIFLLAKMYDLRLVEMDQLETAPAGEV